jgi:hypothetical protein
MNDAKSFYEGYLTHMLGGRPAIAALTVQVAREMLVGDELSDFNWLMEVHEHE